MLGRRLGRILLTLDSVGLLFGAVIADWNETHVFNPRWPPHAKSVRRPVSVPTPDITTNYVTDKC